MINKRKISRFLQRRMWQHVSRKFQVADFRGGDCAGAFTYDTENIGDEIQTIAVLQYFPKSVRLKAVNRDMMRYVEGRPESIALVMNGWHTHNLSGWPPSDAIKPIFEGFHLASPELLEKDENVSYLRNSGKIYCRDSFTATLLMEKGIDAEFGGCPTLTLPKKGCDKTDRILVVDAHRDFGAPGNRPETRDTLQKLVPKEILDKAEILTQQVGSPESQLYAHKLELAARRLHDLEEARLVITNRLHVALPCLALGTPCFFLHEDLANDSRLGDYVQYLHHSTTSDPLKDFDWENPVAKQIPPFVEPLKKRLISRVKDAVKLTR